MDNNLFDKEYWENKINRSLTTYENFMFMKVKSEYKFNKKLKCIYDKAQADNLYIPYLTNMHGNCIFESLKCYDIFEDIDVFRKGLAVMMLMFKNVKNFIPNQELSLSELFVFYNEIELVFCKKTNRLYKYNYDAMCIDLANDTSWTRLNTELIFTVISVIFNVRFIIYHDNGYISNINSAIGLDINQLTIYLGLVNEIHYVPLYKSKDGQHNEFIYYDEGLSELNKWIISNDLII